MTLCAPRLRRIASLTLATLTLSATPIVTTPAHAVTSEELRLPVAGDESSNDVTLDATITVPSGKGPFPAVILAHGFGGSKSDFDDEARQLNDRGFLTVAYTARGFGASGGAIHLNSPDHEVQDAKAIITYLAGRDDVQQDADGDPRVGITGPSYGGALALMTAGADKRVDAIVPRITWNDLSTAMMPQHADGVDTPGPYKLAWVARFFAATQANSLGGIEALLGGSNSDAPAPDADVCGRFAKDVCQAFVESSEKGYGTDQLVDTLSKHSPAPTVGQISAPTLLIQGMTDTLFGIEQAQRTINALPPSTLSAQWWMDGGHDGPSSTADDDTAAAHTWLEHFLKPDTPPTTLPDGVPAFTYAGEPVRGSTDAARLFSSNTPPETDAGTESIPFAQAKPGSMVNPPGGQLASTTTIPLLGGGGITDTVSTYPLAALPGQSLTYTAEPADHAFTSTGSPRLRLRVTADTDVATVYATLWQFTNDTPRLARPLVASARFPVTPGEPKDVTLTLPAASYTVSQGSKWRVLLSTTDSLFAPVTAAHEYKIEMLSDGLEFPVAPPVTARSTGSALPAGLDPETTWVSLATLALLLGIAGWAWNRSRQRRKHAIDPALVDVPLDVSGLVHTYADGHKAVDDVTWRAERGQVVGLLGPNGAGKTTTMRMLLGLIKPDSGSVRILGRNVTPGSPVLRDVGSLVEGPGFLPHLTGRENLHAYWRATGRPTDEADFDTATDVAALGDALDRPTRTYSQGMRMRLGIAQAMLGSPDLLLLDEPTNGLDPPQIAGMRRILQNYAATGRTVVVSSHLLSEVEMTCSHVVVMHAGKVVLTGAVDDLVSTRDVTVVQLEHDPAPTTTEVTEAADTLRGVDGVTSVEVGLDEDASPELVVHSLLPRADVVRAALDAGLRVAGVGGRKHLEDVFLTVISGAAGAGSDDADGDDAASMMDRLRQVRSR